METSDLYQKMYRRRFGKDIEFRNKVYLILSVIFFEKYILKDSIVLGIGAGYDEFINNTKIKIAFNLNSDVKNFAMKRWE